MASASRGSTGEIAAIERELATLKSADNAPLAAAVEGAQAALAEAEAAARRRRGRAHMRARRARSRARRAEPKPKSACSGWRPRRKTLAKMLSLRDQESVAAGDRPRHRRQGLREGARRRARRRSRRAGRSLRADALDRRRRRRRRSGAAGRRRAAVAHVKAPAELARRLAQIGVVDRETGAKLAAAAQDRPAAGVARRRSLALGRLCRRRARADRRRAPARRSAPPCRDRRRAGDGPRRGRRQAPRAGSRASRPSMPPSHAESRDRARASATSTARRRGCRRWPRRARA